MYQNKKQNKQTEKNRAKGNFVRSVTIYQNKRRTIAHDFLIVIVNISNQINFDISLICNI